MRHFLALAISNLPARVRLPATAALLVPPPSLSLSRPPPTPAAAAVAVACPGDVARQAEKDDASAGGIPAGDDVQLDHGPRR
jgi:hypothetical protein